MAVLRQDLLRSTFQERQITLLSSLEKNVNILSEKTPLTMTQTTNKMITSLDNMMSRLAQSISATVRTGNADYTRMTRTMTDIGNDISDQMSDVSGRDAESRQDEADKYRSFMNDKTDAIISTVKSLGTLFSNVLGKFGISLDRYLTEGDKYNQLQNIYVKNTNTTMRDSLSLRDVIIKEVKSLNAETNGLYNQLDSWDTIVGLVNATNIKTSAFYEEYGKMFIETQKTMNLDLGVLANFADKFYRKYNFSSLTMEKLTESIRVNTAGTAVSEDTLMSFIQSMNTDIMAAAMRSGGNVEANYSDLSNKLTGIYSWLNQEGYDPQYLMNLVKGSFSGDQESMVTLGKLGINTSNILDRLINDPATLFSDIVNAMGRTSVATGYGNFGRMMAASYGGDDFYDTAVTAQYRGGLTAQSYYDFIGNRPASEDPNSELYLSAEERVANNTGDLSVTVADLSRNLGINLSTIVDILGDINSFITSAFGSNFLGSALGSFLGGKFIATLVGSGSTGMSSLLVGGAGSLAGILGPALGIGAAAVGLVAIVNGIKDGVDMINDMKSQNKAAFGISSGTDISKPLYFSDLGNGSYGLTSDGISATAGQYGRSQLEGIANRTGITGNETFLETLWKGLVGSGYYGSDTSWYHYIPLIGGIIGSVQRNASINSYNKSVPDINTAYQNVQKYLSKDGATLYKALYAILSTEGQDPTQFAGALASNINTIASTYVSKGYVPTSIGSDGLPKTWKKYQDAPYSSYIDQYLSGDIPMYRMGTNYVNGDQLALVHEGEAIIPAQYNPFGRYSRSGSTGYLGDISSNTSEYSKLAGTYLPYLKELSDTVAQIKDFLNFWRLDELNREAIKSVADSAKSTSLRLSLVTGADS